MNKNVIKTTTAVVGAALLATNFVSQMEPTEIKANAEESTIQNNTTTTSNGNKISVLEREQAPYTRVANVQGEFAYNQNVVTPPDEVFNLFGTVATAMCATPNFAFDKVDIENYYVNFSGAIKQTQTISLNELKDENFQEERTLKCTCATGGAIANAPVVGVPLKNIIQMADIEDTANTVAFKGADGYGVPMPLSYALEKDAILVYRVGEQDIPTGTQVWVPQAVARYFTRNVTEIEFTSQVTLPEIEQAEEEQRAKISVLNKFEDTVFKVGDKIVFEGYADDFDVAISAVEFSMDGGETWTSCTVEDTDTNKWVYWYFGYVADQEGTMKMDVRARTADGKVSPLASSIVFTVAK